MYEREIHPFVRWSRQQQNDDTANRLPEKHRPSSRHQHGFARRLWLFWIVLLVGTLSIASSLVPQPATTPVTGNGGPVASRFCAHPLLVVQHFGITNSTGQLYTATTLPTAAQFATLPKPTANGHVFYEPQTNILCAVSAVVLQSALQQITLPIGPIIPTIPSNETPTSATTTAPPTFSSSTNNLWAQ